LDRNVTGVQTCALPIWPPDVVEVTLALAREMLAASGRDDIDPADRLADGSALDTWRHMVTTQGGDPDAPLPVARERHDIAAPAKTGRASRRVRRERCAL